MTPESNNAGVPNSSRKSPSVFVSLNGSLAEKGKSVGGGDLVLFKFIRLCGLNPDVLIPESAQSFIPNACRLFLTRRNNRLTLVGIVSLFVFRIFQGVFWSFRIRQKYDVALSASPFAVDVIPVWCWKARHKGAVIYHINPKRRAVNWSTRIRFGIAELEQRISMIVLRWACDFIIAGNDYVKGQLIERLPGKQMFVLPAGFDAAFIDAVPDCSKDSNLACFVGRLVSQKGIFDLLRVMKELQSSHPLLRLVIVGTGPERDFLAAEIGRLGIKNIELAGFVSEEGKIALMKKAAYFFFPSCEEGWGIALAEALYCECRCLCYELPHYRSIFGEFPAYVKLGQPQDFARVFRTCGPIASDQKSFMRRYDDPHVARELVNHLSAICKQA